MRGFLYIFSPYIDPNVREITGGTAVWLNQPKMPVASNQNGHGYSEEREDNR